MTDVQPTVATKTISIHGSLFDVRAPYAEGHKCNALEAKVLNQTRAENVANNFRADVKAALDKDAEAGEGVTTELDKVREEFAKYDAEYVFQMGGGGRQPMDPYEREAYAIVREAIKERLREEGKKLKDVPEEALEQAIEQLALQEDVRALAKRRVDEKKAIKTASLADLGLVTNAEAAPAA